MTISELIMVLMELQGQVGDLPVYFADNEYGDTPVTGAKEMHVGEHPAGVVIE